MPEQSFFSELRKRKVVQAAAIYVAVAFGVTEILVTVVEQLFMPQWISTLTVIFFVVGFPIAMFLSWTFDVTSEGIQRTVVSSRRGTASIVLSIVLLVAGTAGLFLLIKPDMVNRGGGDDLAVIAPQSLAVLPFDYSGPDPRDSYLGSGLSDELRDQLGRVEGLGIVARTSSIAAMQKGIDAKSIARLLGVASILEGSMRRQGNTLTVSVALVDGSSGLAIWNGQFKRGPKELLSVQQEIAEAVIREIMPGAEEIVAKPATQNATAYDLMIVARDYERQVRARQIRDDEKLLKAIGLYREATELDPDSALAHSRLAGALVYLGELEAAEAPIFKALAIDPELSELQTTLGEFYWAKGLLGEASTAWKRALELNPFNADAMSHYAYLTSRGVALDPFDTDALSRRSELMFGFANNSARDEGVRNAYQLYHRAVEIDPENLDRYQALGEFLGLYGYVNEVPPVIDRIQRRFKDAASYRAIAWLHELIGEVDRAIAWTIRARDLEPSNPDHVAKLAALYALIGDEKTALTLEPEPNLGVLFHLRRYDDLIDTAEFMMIDQPANIEIRYVLAFGYMATGAFEQAIRILHSTGLPGTMLEGRGRGTADGEALMTLINALVGSGLTEADKIARSLASGLAEMPFSGEIGWIAIFKGCNLAILGRHEEALAVLPRIKESPRLRRPALLYDMYCFDQYAEEPAYIDVVNDLEARRAAHRTRLPQTLTDFGVAL